MINGKRFPEQTAAQSGIGGVNGTFGHPIRTNVTFAA
jgi:hypothetical protein